MGKNFCVAKIDHWMVVKIGKINIPFWYGMFLGHIKQIYSFEPTQARHNAMLCFSDK
jgi:hypothetical protein